MSFRIGRALVYATVIWMTGFIWGTIVFMTPALTREAIPYVSSNPGISFPLLVLWPILVYLLTRSFVNSATVTSYEGLEGLKLGLVFSVVNLVLDLVVLVILLKAGFGYFASLTVWIAYGLLLVVPWLTGRAMERAEGYLPGAPHVINPTHDSKRTFTNRRDHGGERQRRWRS